MRVSHAFALAVIAAIAADYVYWNMTDRDASVKAASAKESSRCEAAAMAGRDQSLPPEAYLTHVGFLRGHPLVDQLGCVVASGRCEMGDHAQTEMDGSWSYALEFERAGTFQCTLPVAVLYAFSADVAVHFLE